RPLRPLGDQVRRPRLGPRARAVVVPVRPAHAGAVPPPARSEEHTSELQSLAYLVCRLLFEKKTASFQETTGVLTVAAVSTRIDNLQWLQENVIVGLLILAESCSVIAQMGEMFAEVDRLVAF